MRKTYLRVIKKVLLILTALLPIFYFYFILKIPFEFYVFGSGSWGMGCVVKIMAGCLVATAKKKGLGKYRVALINGLISGMSELTAALIMIVIMINNYPINLEIIIAFGLGIGAIEILSYVNKGKDILKGTSLEKSYNETVDYYESLNGLSYVWNTVIIDVYDRICRSLIHVSTGGLVFVSILKKDFTPFIWALIVFIMADGFLGYFFIDNKKLLSSKGNRRYYVFFTILTVLSVFVFFVYINRIDFY